MWLISKPVSKTATTRPWPLIPLSQRGWTLISEFSSLTLFGLVFGAIVVSAVLLVVTSLLAGVPLAWVLLFCFTSTFSACGVDWIVFSAFFSIVFSGAGVASVVLAWVVETTGVAVFSTSAASAPFWAATANPAPTNTENVPTLNFFTVYFNTLFLN